MNAYKSETNRKREPQRSGKGNPWVVAFILSRRRLNAGLRGRKFPTIRLLFLSLSLSLSPFLLSSVISFFRVSRNHPLYLHFFFARSHATLITNFASLTIAEYATEIDSQTSTGKIPLPYKEIYRESAADQLRRVYDFLWKNWIVRDKRWRLVVPAGKSIWICM